MKLTKEQNMARLEAVANVTDWSSVKLAKDGKIQKKYYEGRGYYALAACSFGITAILANVGYKIAALREKAQDTRDGIKTIRSIIEQVNKEIKKEEQETKKALRALVEKVENSISKLVSYENKKRDALVGDEVELDVEALLKDAEETKPAENTTQVEAAASVPAVTVAEPREAAATVETQAVEAEGSNANGETVGAPSASSPLIDSDDEDLVRQMLAQPEPARRGMKLRSGRTLAPTQI